MKTIWKYPLLLQNTGGVIMPRGARLLHVDNQNGVICLWAEVTPGEAPERRDFVVVGTGHPLPPERDNYIGSVMIPPFVWHVYEREMKTDEEQDAARLAAGLTDDMKEAARRDPTPERNAEATEKERLRQLVRDFSDDMVTKLFEKLDQDWSGWREMSEREILRAIAKHLPPAYDWDYSEWDPVDVANFCAFESYRREHE